MRFGFRLQNYLLYRQNVCLRKRKVDNNENIGKHNLLITIKFVGLEFFIKVDGFISDINAKFAALNPINHSYATVSLHSSYPYARVC